MTSIIIILVVSLMSLSKIRNIEVRLEVSNKSIIESTQLRSDLNRLRALRLEYILENNESEGNAILALGKTRLDSLWERVQSIKDLIKGKSEIESILHTVADGIKEYEKNSLDQNELIKSGKRDEAYPLTKTKQSPLYNSMRLKLLSIEEKLKMENSSLDQQTRSLIKTSWMLLLSLGIVLIVISIGIITMILRSFSLITREIREGVNILATSSAQMQTTFAEISTGAAETATAISETTTTIEEIRQTSVLANQKARHLLEGSRRASDFAEKGIESSQKMIDAMTSIDSQMKIIINTINSLAEQNRSIGEITSTVSDIADQSNLLAVNAAIEAAKAGEHGRGFTVVAQEIRSLAEQSKKSTAQVKEILNDVQKSVQKTVEVIKQGSVSVAEGSRLVNEDKFIVEMLTDNVEASAQASLQISSTSEQQMSGMDQIVPAMENIKQASEQNVSAIHQLQGASNDLKELGRSLKSVIDRYKL
jgi:methyl-accepting chemotaxis protein